MIYGFSILLFMVDLLAHVHCAIQDYYATIYSAEIINTLTNLLFMWLGVRGIMSCRRYQHDQIFLIAYCGYLVVGTGSFLFHSTLKCTPDLPGL